MIYFKHFKNPLFSSETEVTTTSLIWNSRNLKPQKWYDSPQKKRIPSMPFMPVIHSNTPDPLDFTVKGSKIPGTTSSPALNEYPSIKASITDDQIPELILQEEAVMSRSDSSGGLEMISRLDRKHPYAAGQIDVDDVEHLLPFVKKAAPDLHGHYPMVENEPLLEKKAWLNRLVLLFVFDHLIGALKREFFQSLTERTFCMILIVVFFIYSQAHDIPRFRTVSQPGQNHKSRCL